MNTLDLTPDQLRQMSGTVERFQKYLEDCSRRFLEMSFPEEDLLRYRVAQMQLQVQDLHWLLDHYAKDANRGGPPPTVVHPLNAGEFIDQYSYVVAHCVVREAGRQLTYQVAIAADTPCPFSRDFTGTHQPHRRQWIGGRADQADLEGRMFERPGITLSSSYDLWLQTRTMAEAGTPLKWYR